MQVRKLIIRQFTLTWEVYDALGRRSERIDYRQKNNYGKHEDVKRAEAERVYVYDGFWFEVLLEIGEMEVERKVPRGEAWGWWKNREPGEVMVSEYVYGDGRIVSRTDYSEEDIGYYGSRGKNKVYYTQEVLGSTVMITDSMGKMKESYSYDAFGNHYEGDFQRANEHGYNGKRYDPAVNLYDYGYRNYKPVLGRWTTIDPIRDTNNCYVYVNNNPLKFIDLAGLAPRNISESERETYKERVGEMEPDDFPNEYDCADTAAYIAKEGYKAADPNMDIKINTQWGPTSTDIQGVQAKDFFGEGNKNVNFYEAGSSTQSYNPENIDTSFNSPNVEVGTVGVYAPPNQDVSWTGHVITVKEMERDIEGNVSLITVLQGHMILPHETKVITSQQDLEGLTSGTFVGWGEFEPKQKGN